MKCGTLAQTNGCPLAGAKGPILNKVNPLAAPFAATASQPPAPPMSRSHGPSASVIVTIIAVVILATTGVLLFLWDYQKRERARQVLHDSRGNWTVVIRLENYNGRLEHRRVMLLGRPHAQPSVEHGRVRADSVAYLPNGL